jgi:flavin-dependent dehydrogenase
MFDVIVCGAGPAGSVAATVLARGGARVLLIDRARFPRDKLCGDTINPGALAILRRLDMAGAIEATARRLEGMIVTGQRGVGVRSRYGRDRYALSIVRRDLDLALVHAAVAAGARFEEGVLVRGPLVDGGARRVRGVVLAGRDGRDVRVPAPLVIAADGRRSRLAIPLGLSCQPGVPRRWAIGGYFTGAEGLQPFGEMHVRRGHYLGVAPVPGDLANVCLVVPAPLDLRNPAALLRQALAADAVVADRFAAARMVAPPAVMGPLAVDTSAAGTDGLLLAGDAAGFIDPMTGDGLRFAVRGGELAAEVALAALAGRLRRPHRTLARARVREFGAKWRFNRVLRRLVASGTSVELAGAVAARAPWILQRAIRFAGDVP